MLFEGPQNRQKWRFSFGPTWSTESGNCTISATRSTASCCLAFATHADWLSNSGHRLARQNSHSTGDFATSPREPYSFATSRFASVVAKLFDRLENQIETFFESLLTELLSQPLPDRTFRKCYRKCDKTSGLRLKCS